MAMEDSSGNGHRFRRIPRQSCAAKAELDPLINENLEQWPHLNELIQCYKADWVKDESKYGHYESVAPSSFQSQIFEGPDTDMETEIRLASARHSNTEDIIEDEIPSTSGRQISECGSYIASSENLNAHFGESPLPAYEPAFDWGNERSLIFGQRMPESYPAHYSSGLKITVKVLSLSFQAGLHEPFYGTICLYNRERREKMSEDFYFHVLPTEVHDASASTEVRGLFSLEIPSAAICLLIQIEKPTTEEGGVTPSVYSRKEPVHLTEREKQKLQVWSRIMPFRESFAWAVIPLFENNNVTSGGASSPSIPLVPSVSGSSSQDNAVELTAKNTMDGKLAHYSSGSSVIVEISNLNKVKESYTEDSLQDPKRKLHKPVKGVLRLEVEKLHAAHPDVECISESGSMINDFNFSGDQLTEPHTSKYLGNGSVGLRNCDLNSGVNGGKDLTKNVPNVNNPDFNSDDFQAVDFRMVTRNEPFSQLLHILYVYPLTVCLSRKRNLFIRVELRKDDADIRKQPLEVMYPRHPDEALQKWAHTQVAVGARTACYHDEIKISLPALLTPQLHLLFTFFSC